MKTLPPKRTSSFLRNHSDTIDIMLDRDLAKLGDLYINFTYSLAKSYIIGKGSNIRVSSKILSESLKQTGLRNLLPKRTSIHDQADAVEALVVYSWFKDTISLDECVNILSEDGKDDVEHFTNLLKHIVRRIEPSNGEPCTIQGD